MRVEGFNWDLPAIHRPYVLSRLCHPSLSSLALTMVRSTYMCILLFSTPPKNSVLPRATRLCVQQRVYIGKRSSTLTYPVTKQTTHRSRTRGPSILSQSVATRSTTPLDTIAMFGDTLPTLFVLQPHPRSLCLAFETSTRTKAVSLAFGIKAQLWS